MNFSCVISLRDVDISLSVSVEVEVEVGMRIYDDVQTWTISLDILNDSPVGNHPTCRIRRLA